MVLIVWLIERSRGVSRLRLTPLFYYIFNISKLVKKVDFLRSLMYKCTRYSNNSRLILAREMDFFYILMNVKQKIKKER